MRGEGKADPGLAHARRHRVRIEIDRDPQGFEQVEAARGRRRLPVAMLAHHRPRAGGDEAGHGRDVERSDPARRCAPHADDVDRLGGELEGFGSIDHGADQAGQLVDALALEAQGDDEGRDLGIGRLTGEDGAERRSSSFAAEIRAVGEGAENRRPPLEGGVRGGLPFRLPIGSANERTGPSTQPRSSERGTSIAPSARAVQASEARGTSRLRRSTPMRRADLPQRAAAGTNRTGSVDPRFRPRGDRRPARRW